MDIKYACVFLDRFRSRLMRVVRVFVWLASRRFFGCVGCFGFFRPIRDHSDWRLLVVSVCVCVFAGRRAASLLASCLAALVLHLLSAPISSGLQ
jgi:hypothetical protein